MPPKAITVCVLTDVLNCACVTTTNIDAILVNFILEFFIDSAETARVAMYS